MNTDLMLLRSILDVILVANVSDLSFSAAMQQKKSVFIPLICVIRVLITRILMRLLPASPPRRRSRKQKSVIATASKAKQEAKTYPSPQPLFLLNHFLASIAVIALSRVDFFGLSSS